MNLTPAELVDQIAQFGDIQTMLRKALPLMVAHLGADNGSLMLLSGDRVVQKVLANRETFTQVSEHKVRTVLSSGLAGWALRNRRGGLASDTAADERWVSMGDTAIASAMVVPMFSRNTITGLLSFHHGERGYFRESHLARAAELGQLVGPPFDIALMNESAIASLQTLCNNTAHPCVLVDAQGQVKAVNPAMQALDIVWADGTFEKSLLPRELDAATIADCEWDGLRPLATLAYTASVLPFHGIGLWIQLSPKA